MTNTTNTDDTTSTHYESVVRSIKGMSTAMQCSPATGAPPFQFEIGKTFEVSGDVKACKSGFHACPVDHHPFSVFEFYPPAGSRYFDVAQGGMMDAHGTKLASATITIDFEISLGDMVKRAIDWVFKRAKWEGAASATGDRGAASATGEQGAASATGEQGAASATGYRGAASATGYLGAASATGYLGAASATGADGMAIASGPLGVVRGDVDGIDLVAREFGFEGGRWVWKSTALGRTGQNGIRAGTSYRCQNSTLVEVGA